VSVPRPAATVEGLLAAYNAAWNRHDLDAICALHTQDMVFDAHIGGPPASGDADVRAQIGGLFLQWPDLAFQARRLRVCGDLIVQEWTATGTLAIRVELGGLVAEPGGEPISWHGLDLIEVEHDKVKRKESYADVMSILLGLGALDG
jgi:hypothetical protein